MPKKKTVSRAEQRAIRAQRIVFIAIGVIVILSMVIALISK